MTDLTRLDRLAGPLDPLLTTVAGRIGLAAASRIRRGCLTVQLPDGSRRVFGDRDSELRGEMHIHDLEALRRLLLGGEVGGGEAYMDGLWSSPDLVALISLAVANRTDLALSKGWWRLPAKVGRTIAHRRNRNTKRWRAAQHHGPLRPGQRLLPPLARRDDDLLERRLRDRPSSRWPTPSATSTAAWPSWPASSAGSTCWRSAPAGAASRCMPPASWAAE